jgi:hypothetical protein
VRKRSWVGSAWLLTAACTGQIGDGDATSGPPGPTPVIEGFEPAAPVIRRLLARQYLNSIEAVLGAEARAAAIAPDDQALNGFDSIAASQLNIGDAAVVDYEKSGRAAAAAAVEAGALASYFSCEPSSATDAACLEEFVQELGRLLYRRTLTADETSALVDIGVAAAEAYGSFDAALEYATATMLESPHFLYQVELGEPSGDPNLRRLTALETATRLSFFLLDTTPSRELLDAAEAGELDSPEGLRAMAEEIVETQGARGAARALFGEVLDVRALANEAKSPVLYPDYTPEIVALMQEETARLIEAVTFEPGYSLDDLLTADHTFVNAQLAAFYGLPAPQGDGWERVDYPAEQPRTGFFGQGSFLAGQAHVELTSPTLRGKFVRERLLCESINPPPNDVSTEFPDDQGLLTMRERLEVHQTVPQCAACHRLTDPIGLAFENLDTVGQFRTTENGVTIDPSGELDEQGKFAGARQLAGLIASHPRFVSCAVRNVYRSSMGHLETEGEDPLIEELTLNFDKNGRHLKDLFVDLVSSDAFRFVGAIQ